MGKREPELRFAGYSEEWIGKRFGDEFDFLPNNTLSRDKLNYDYGEGLNVHYGDVLIKFGEYLDIEKEILPFITDTVIIDKLSNSILKDGDIIIADTAEDTTVGKCTEIINVGNKKILSGLHTIPCRPKNVYSPRFLGYCLNSEKYHNKLLPLIQGVKVSSISKSGIQDTEIVVTENQDEQYKIGFFLSKLDELVKEETAKHNKLMTLKSAMMEKMFPKGKKKVPEIRFLGFGEEWERHKLLDCIQKITDFRGRTPKKLGMEWSTSGYLALSALNVKNGYIDFSQDVHYGNQELYDKWMSGNELHKGQVLFTTEAPVGNVAQVPDNRGYILSQRTIAFDVKPELITENFLATILRTQTVFSDLTALSSGGTAKGVSQKSLESVEIIIPKNLKEQEQLAELFCNFDNLITLHQRKIEKIKNIKVACMKKMFV